MRSHRYSLILFVSVFTLVATIAALHCFDRTNIAMADTSSGNPEVEVSVDPQQGSVEDSFQLSITLSGALASETLAQASVPELGESTDFAINSQGRSSRITIINGRTSQEATFTFEVTPRADLPPGRYRLPDITIPVESGSNKQTLKHDGPDIEIVKTTQPPSERTRVEGKAGDAGVGFSQSVSSLTPFVGEQVHYQLSLQAPGEVVPEQVSDFGATGMWKEPLSADRSQIHGSSPRSVRLVDQELALFPTQSGEQQINSRSLRAQVPRISKRTRRPFPFGGFGSDDFFDDFSADFFGGAPFMNLEERRFTAPAITLKVKPLPPAPSPNLGYIPVGKISIASSVASPFDRDTVETGETVTAKVELYGDANLRPLNLSFPTSSSDPFNVYPSQPTTESLVQGPQGDRVYFKKTFQWAVVPTKPGKLTLPSLTVVTFDPTAGEYKTLRTPELTLTVSGAAISQDSNVSPNRNTQIPKMDRDIGISRNQTEQELPAKLETDRRGYSLSKLPAEVLVLVVCVLGLFVFYKRERAASRLSISPEAFLVQLARQSKQLSLDSVLEAIRSYADLLSDDSRFATLGNGNRIPEHFVERLAEWTSDSSLISQAKSLRQRIEAVRYAPEAEQPADNALARDLVNYLAAVSVQLAPRSMNFGSSKLDNHE